MTEIIINAVSDYYGVSVQDMKGRRRFADVVHARHIAMFILLRDANLTQQEAADALGRSDHSSAFHAREKIYDRIRLESHVRDEVDELTRLINGIQRSHIRTQYEIARERAAA